MEWHIVGNFYNSLIPTTNVIVYMYVDKCIHCVWTISQVTLLNCSLTKQESSRVKCFPSYEIQGMDKARETPLLLIHDHCVF